MLRDADVLRAVLDPELRLGGAATGAAKREPRLSLNALTNTDYLEVDQPGASPWLAGLDIDDFADSVPAAVSALGFDAISPSHTILTPAMVAEAHEAGAARAALHRRQRADDASPDRDRASTA